MKILLKFLLRNILEKKLRTILIILSITLSTALVFSTLSMSGTVRQMMTNQLRKYTGTSEIVIQRDRQSLSNPFFDIVDMGDLNQQLEYTVGNIQSFATYPKDENQSVYLAGFSLDDLIKMYDISFLEENVEAFIGYKVIIGEGEASQLGVKLGDTIELKINKENYDFVVHAIVKPKGLFNYDGQRLSMIVPKETLATIYQVENQVNTIYIKTNNENVKLIMDSLSEKYHDDFVVTTTITTMDIDNNIKGLTSTFSLMLIMVIFISVFIIFTAFKVITIERLPMVGTFRSIGATKKMTDVILLGESIIYGTIGGILGCVLGFGILSIMMNMMAYNAYTKVTATVELVFGIDIILISFFVAITLSVISAIIPIVKISKMPVRNIVLNQLKEVIKNNKIKTVIGLVIISSSFILLRILDRPSIIVSGLCIVLIGMGIVMIIPFLTRLFVLIFERVNVYLFKNEGILAAKNLRDNKGVIQNITLLTIGIATLLMINTISHSVGKEVANVYNNANFDIVFNYDKADEAIAEKLLSIEGVSSLNGDYATQNIKIVEKNDYIGFVWGVDPEEYFNYWDIDFIGNKTRILEQLDQGRNTIISTVIRDKYDLKVGDHITLKMKEGEFSYTIIGFTSTLLNNGNFIFVDENYFKMDSGINYMSSIMIRTSGKPTDVLEKIKKEFETDHINIFTMDEQLENNNKANKQMFDILQGFSLITMIIGMFGIFNNFMVSYLSRIRSLAIYRSIGMSKNQVLKMLLIESVCSGIIGGISGILGGLLFISISAYIMVALYVPVSMHYSTRLFIYALIVGVLVSLFSALIPSIRSKKLNIIESIKYE